MAMDEAEGKLRRIKEDLDNRRVPEQATVRELLGWFGSTRRGAWINAHIRRTLDQYGIVTKPAFESPFIDEHIFFERNPANIDTDSSKAQEQSSLPDPTYRVGKLSAANTRPVSVKPDDTVRNAVTLMLSHDFSQLPVMTNERTVKGIISWTSLGSRLALGKDCEYARQCMETHQEINADMSLLAAIDTIVGHQYVLIRNARNEIGGIVTTSDLSVQFKQLGEPFLLIGEIENYIRRMLQDKFTREEIADAKDPADGDRPAEAISDLTFGEYQRLLEKPDRWNKLGLGIDRAEFLRMINDIRRIRNDVMHFEPEGLEGEDLDALRAFAGFLRRLAGMNAI